MNHLNLTLCDNPVAREPGFLPLSRLRNSSVAAQVEELAQIAQDIADEIGAASQRLEMHESDDTGDAALTDPEDVVALLTPTRGALAVLAPLARAMREASR
jgi:hypothetical protein